MNQFLFFVKKEFLHVWRDKRSLIILFGMPLSQILIFGFALTNEVKNSRLAILDQSQDETTKAIIQKIMASPYFDLTTVAHNVNDLYQSFQEGEIQIAVVFPPQFQFSLYHNREAAMQCIADATDPNAASTRTQYIRAIIADYQKSIWLNEALPYEIRTELRMLYNPQLKGSYNFVPGVMAMVLMLVCTMMTSISIVKEKEMGTLEVILVSPIVPFRLIMAKMIPYLLVSMGNITSILCLGRWVLDVPIHGSLSLLIGECLLFTLCGLALGLLISTIASSQQVAMMVSLMGILLPTVMLSGFMFPLENMPVLLQIISNFIPSRWFYDIIQSIMIQGVGVEYVWKETVVLAIMLLVFMLISIRKFKIRLE